MHICKGNIYVKTCIFNKIKLLWVLCLLWWNICKISVFVKNWDDYEAKLDVIDS